MIRLAVIFLALPLSGCGSPAPEPPPANLADMSRYIGIEPDAIRSHSHCWGEGECDYLHSIAISLKRIADHCDPEGGAMLHPNGYPFSPRRPPGPDRGPVAQ